jgi:hypothetical protein
MAAALKLIRQRDRENATLAYQVIVLLVYSRAVNRTRFLYSAQSFTVAPASSVSGAASSKHSWRSTAGELSSGASERLRRSEKLR